MERGGRHLLRSLKTISVSDVILVIPCCGFQHTQIISLSRSVALYTFSYSYIMTIYYS